MFLFRGVLIDVWEDAASFQVTDVLPYPRVMGEEGIARGLVLSEFEFVSC